MHSGRIHLSSLWTKMVRFVILFLMLIKATIRADPETGLLIYTCGNTPPNNATLFAQILNSSLASLLNQVAPSGFATTDKEASTETTTDSLYVLAQCRKDKSPADCVNCVRVAEDRIRNCSSVSAKAYYDGCYLRYENTNFYDLYTDATHKPICGNVDAANSSLFSGNTGKKKKVSSSVWISTGVVGGVFLFGLLICLNVFRNQIMRPEEKHADIEGATELRGAEDFDFKTLKKATNNFDQANKLGQGGFGEVFKATLKNGKVVAVKKLMLRHSAPRAISEFESEVKLISNVHHRNLVRLLGCCRKGQERLLIYEYMPNGSLDRILFGKNKRLLSWKERLEIIVGTARGLAYLHEEFHVCIIHRDIKSGNILLDENFKPKLADFGLARLLPNDRTHVSTRFAGTLGYTAPEYAGQGKLTEKADTYSFGVVVLEILSGRKSIDLKQPPDMQYLLQWVRSLYEDNNKVIEMVESELKEMDGYNEDEVLRVINLALQCIQASARQRPSMSEVVTVLSSKDEIDFQKPLQLNLVAMGNIKVSQEEGSTSSYQSNATITESLGAR